MKKLMKVALLVMAMCLLLTGCQIPSDLPFELPFDIPFLHEHLWLDATCTTPKTCATCGETEGDPLPHTWVDATCTTAKTCSVCKATDGEVPGHSWKDATCTAPKTCSACSITEGEPNGHSWKDATCTAPKTCSACGETEGEPNGHSWVDATCSAPKTCSACQLTEGGLGDHVWVEATCKAPKTCSACQLTEGERGDHDWVDATCTAPKTCSVCKATEGEALGHVHIVRPTCEAGGSISSKCKNCEHVDESYPNITHNKLTCTANFLAVDCRVGQTNKDLDGDGTVAATNYGYFITNYGPNKITPFKFLNFGDGDTCEVTFYIFNGTSDTLTNINLSYGFPSHAFASEADAKAGNKIPGTSVDLNLAPGEGKIVTMTIPRECYISNTATSLTDKTKVSYQNMGLRINLTPATEKATNKIFISCLSDSVVTESLALTQSNGSTANTTWLRNGKTYGGTVNGTAVDTAIAEAFASYYEAGYTCIHEATPKG